MQISKSSGGTTTISIFAGSQVVAEYDNGAAPTSPSREFIYALGQRVAEISGSSTYYFQTDHLSVRMLTDSNGNVVDQLGHFPYGEAWYETGPTTTPSKFTTYYRDSESNNDYALARHYINRFGRFMTVDPAGMAAQDLTNPQSWNLYAYVRNNPVGLTDPTGLWCVWDDGTGHDPDPSEGGWDEGDCADQGGHWDSSDTVYNIWTNDDGDVVGISSAYGLFFDNNLSIDLADLDSWFTAANNLNVSPLAPSPATLEQCYDQMNGSKSGRIFNTAFDFGSLLEATPFNENWAANVREWVLIPATKYVGLNAVQHSGLGGTMPDVYSLAGGTTTSAPVAGEVTMNGVKTFAKEAATPAIAMITWADVTFRVAQFQACSEMLQATHSGGTVQ
ncbi:MAG TPA: RHS repeat-associated core domain-containing protein [Candidatus Acidoferrum sp.]|nr:RHS repeat-associated core domain-containing protein [Candidatus Acidoferrum sp.]